MMKQRALCLCACALLAATAAVAQTERKNKIALGLGWFDSTGGDALVAGSVDLPGNDSAGFELNYGFDNTGGLAIDYERRVTERMGVTASVLAANHDLNVDIGLRPPLTVDLPPDLQALDGEQLLVGDTTVIPVTFATTFHLLRSGPVDFSIAVPMLGWAFFDTLSLDEETATLLADNNLVFSTDDDLDGSFVFGLGAFVDVPFGNGRWNFSSSVRYLLYGTELTVEIIDDTPDAAMPTRFETVDVDVNPLVIHVGVAYRF